MHSYAEALGAGGGQEDSASFLTPRQREVLALLGQGKSNKEIARVLQLAEGTVKLHVTAILKALNVNNRTRAVVAASQQPRPHRQRHQHSRPLTSAATSDGGQTPDWHCRSFTGNVVGVPMAFDPRHQFSPDILEEHDCGADQEGQEKGRRQDHLRKQL